MIDSVDGVQLRRREGVGKEVSHLCPGGGAGIIVKIPRLDQPFFHGILHIRPVPVCAGTAFHGAFSIVVHLVDPAGQRQGFGHTDRAPGIELPVRPLHQAVLIADLCAVGIPRAAPHVLELARIGGSLLKVAHMLGRRRHGAQPQGQRRGQDQRRQFAHLHGSFLLLFRISNTRTDCTGYSGIWQEKALERRRQRNVCSTSTMFSANRRAA